MGFVTDMGKTESLVSAKFQTRSQSITFGELGAYTWTDSSTVSGLLWEGSAMDNVVSEKMRADVDAVLVVDYDSTVAALADTCRVVVSSVNYHVVHIEDVGRQNQVLNIMLKRELTS